ncbi:MAG: hypothetical protein NUK65_13185 [Firmicutes bacterium]|nr:hypothetical protein [Bacillota bacterium]
MEALMIVLFVISTVTISYIQSRNHRYKIIKQIDGMGGKVLFIERKRFDTGPFLLFRRGRSIYKIKYSIEDEIKEGWVKFGDLFGPEWRLEEFGKH